MKSIVEERISRNEFVLVAEIGVNYYDIATKEHISNMDAAKLMIDEAKKAGIHAVKFQTYKANTLAAKESPYYWDLNEEPTRSQFELFQKYDTFGKDEYAELAAYCEEKGIEFMSTPFDVESVEYLDEMMNVYKISSSDLNNLPFVEMMAKKNKPIMLSIGASEEEEIRRTVSLIRKYNNQKLILLHCVLEYPTPYEDANLNKIVTLKREFPDCIIGYSDHTKPDSNYDVIKTAYNLGAQVIEKHYTLDKTLKGNDHYHAMDEKDAKNIIEEIEKINKIRGTYELKCLETEAKARSNARRSVVAKCDINKGTKIERDMLTFKRPASGIPINEMELVIGRTAKEDIKEDTILQYAMLDGEK